VLARKLSRANLKRTNVGMLLPVILLTGLRGMEIANRDFTHK